MCVFQTAEWKDFGCLWSNQSFRSTVCARSCRASPLGLLFFNCCCSIIVVQFFSVWGEGGSWASFLRLSIYVEILQRRAKFQTALVSCSRFNWITQFPVTTGVFELRISCIVSCISLQISCIPNPNGLGNYFVCKRFAVHTVQWSLEIVIQLNLEHDTIAIIHLCNLVWELPHLNAWFDLG